MVLVVYEQGDVLFLNFSPSKGHEPTRRHPAVVVSATRVNYLTNLTLLAPITSTDNRFPLHIPLGEHCPVAGFVQCEALRALDLTSRPNIEHVGAVDDDTLSSILEGVGVVIGI